MTPRERILTLLNGNQPDQVPWFGDLDYWATALISQNKMPENFRLSDAYLDWHRNLGVGFYLQGYFPFSTHYESVDVKEWHEGNNRLRQITTPVGTLKECWQWLLTSYSTAPIEHLVKTAADLPAFRYLCEHSYYEPDYALAERRYHQIGDLGIVLCYLPKSPFMQLLVLEAGIENLTSILMDAPDEFQATIDAMTRCHDSAAQIALNSPAEALMIPENLSAEMVGPRLFEQFMRGYQERWIKKIAAARKHSFIHMDGTLRGLLREECTTGITVLEALTPAPVGDLPIEEWLDFAGNSKTIFWGGLPGSYFTPRVSDREFERHAKQVLSVMTQHPRFVLGVADQVPPDAMEYRVRRVRELVDSFGNYR
ncbi:hypothetical protein JXJ21_26470 [candidate division KSB1 bacterium]|nr:hypothetical protein [candidate division KSB1 bacterium]